MIDRLLNTNDLLKKRLKKYNLGKRAALILLLLETADLKIRAMDEINHSWIARAENNERLHYISPATFFALKEEGMLEKTAFKDPITDYILSRRALGVLS